MDGTINENSSVTENMKTGRDKDNFEGISSGLTDVKLNIKNISENTEAKTIDVNQFFACVGELRKKVNKTGDPLSEKTPAFKSGYLYGLEQGREFIDALYEREIDYKRQLEASKKAGYVEGVCGCVAAIGDDHALGKKLLTEMYVTRDMAKQYARPETYKTLEQGIFAQKPEQKLEQAQGVKR